MRPSHAIAGLLLLAGMMPASSYADAPGPMPSAQAARPGCRCPGIRHVRHVHHRYVRHFRYRRLVPLIAVAPLPYNAPIPSPWDTAYDRGMTLHFRSPAVSGTWIDEPGLPHTPPIRPVQWYRVPYGVAVLQYDGLTGEYITLAQADAVRALPPALPPPPAVPLPAPVPRP